MKNLLSSVIIKLLTVLFLINTLPVTAQPSSPVTLPKSGSPIVTKNPKIPPLNLPCKLSTGEDRPFPCEFRLDRIVLYGINGVVLGQVTPASHTITVPFAKLSQSPPAVITAMAINVRFFFTRINPPNFPEVNLLLAEISHSPNDKLNKPADTGLAAVSKISVGQQFESVIQTLVWPVTYKGEKQLPFSAELYAFLPNTRDKLKAKYGATLPLKDQSEASMLLNLNLTYE